MRKITTRLPLMILSLFLFSNFSALATDPVFTLKGGDVCEDSTVDVPITVGDFTDMISFQFSIGWNPAVIQIEEIININAAVSENILFGNFNSESEVITVSWFDNAIAGVTIPDDEVLFTITYNVVGDNSVLTSLEFQDEPTMREVSSLENGNIEIITATWNDDMVMVDQPELGSVTITDDVNMTGVGSVDITISNGTAPYSYAWESGETTEDLVDVSMGSYTCVVTDDKGCITSVGPFEVDNIVGTKDIEGLESVNIYPNPSKGLVNLSASLTESQLIEINVYTIFGQKVYFDQVESTIIEQELDLSDLANGSYIIQLTNNDGMYTQKLQLHR